MIRRLDSSDFHEVFNIFMEHDTFQGTPLAAHHWHEVMDGLEGASFFDLWHDTYKTRLQEVNKDIWYAYGSFNDGKLTSFAFMKKWSKDGLSVGTLGYSSWTLGSRTVDVFDLLMYAIGQFQKMGIYTYYTITTAPNYQWTGFLSENPEYVTELIETIPANTYPKDKDFYWHIMYKYFTVEARIFKVTKLDSNLNQNYH